MKKVSIKRFTYGWADSSFRLSLVCLLLILGISCKPEPPGPVDSPKPSKGSVLLLNEGNFQWGNASLDLYDPETEILQSGIFKSANQQALGDVLQSMSIFQDKGYLVVNNSGKIEVVNPTDMTSLGTIEGLTSPRFFLGISSSKAYVSDLYANAIAIVDLSDQAVSGSISCPGWTEQMLSVGEMVFVTNIRQPYLYVVNSQTDLLVDSIRIREGGNRIVRDQEGMLWVACGELIQPDESGALYRINPENWTLIDSFLFSPATHPDELTINASGDQLFFLNGGVQRMPIAAAELPQNPLIPEDGGLFYGLGVDPFSDEIYVTDAIDFVQRGAILRYDLEGNLLHEFRAGIIPGRFYFQPK